MSRVVRRRFSKTGQWLRREGQDCATSFAFRFGAERGNIAPLAVVSTMVLLAVLAFSVDQGIACAVKVRQENALDAARDACMDASFALVAKNEENPGRVMADRITNSLKQQGFEGKASIWFYEVPAIQVPSSRRVWGIAIQIQEQAPTMFARGFGIAYLPVASKRVMTAEPYSDTLAWRPRNSGSGLYVREFSSETKETGFSSMSEFGEYPAELVDEVRMQLMRTAEKMQEKRGFL